jgi:hypothetical protein
MDCGGSGCRVGRWRGRLPRGPGRTEAPGVRAAERGGAGQPQESVACGGDGEGAVGEVQHGASDRGAFGLVAVQQRRVGDAAAGQRKVEFLGLLVEGSATASSPSGCASAHILCTAMCRTSSPNLTFRHERPPPSAPATDSAGRHPVAQAGAQRRGVTASIRPSIARSGVGQGDDFRNHGSCSLEASRRSWLRESVRGRLACRMEGRGGDVWDEAQDRPDPVWLALLY